mmetsp:Transcript_4119/g.6530  ORF Transcript_4119/g.6530 Transcript_4119/m.6530 type:complete len:220 (-) Transcript_4119:932-1591(-)
MSSISSSPGPVSSAALESYVLDATPTPAPSSVENPSSEGRLPFPFFNISFTLACCFKRCFIRRCSFCSSVSTSPSSTIFTFFFDLLLLSLFFRFGLVTAFGSFRAASHAASTSQSLWRQISRQRSLCAVAIFKSSTLQDNCTPSIDKRTDSRAFLSLRKQQTKWATCSKYCRASCLETLAISMTCSTFSPKLLVFRAPFPVAACGSGSGGSSGGSISSR